jgi:hypothetical protein
MSGDAPHLHMLNLIAGGILASLDFYRWLGVTVRADAVGPHVQGIEPDTLFFPTQPLLGHEYQFDLDTAEGQLFLNRMLAFLQRWLEPAPGRETQARSG